MNFPESNPDYQILLSKMRIFSQENSSLLANLGLEITVKSNLSKQDQVYQIFSSNFEIPVEITCFILSYLPVTHLYKKLDCDFRQLQFALEKTGYDKFQEELKKTKGFYYEDGIRMETNKWYICEPIYMKLMLKVLKTEIVEFFLRDEWKLTELITGNRLDLIKIIYSETNAFLKIDNILDDAASYGLIEYVIYLSEMGASCSMEANVNAAECGHLDVVKWLHFNRSEGSTTYAIDKAAANGHLDVVKWLHFNRSEGCTTDAIDNAAAFGHLEIVKWLHQNRSEGCSTDAIDNAASNGHLDIVKWLHNNRAEGCTTYAIDYAAANGHLDIVKWLHQNRSEGCTTYAIDYAAANGHLDIVKWLHQNRSEGCVLALLGATRHFQLSVVKYLVENNLGVDRIHDAINSPITAYYSSEKHQQMQEIKNYLRSL